MVINLFYLQACYRYWPLEKKAINIIKKNKTKTLVGFKTQKEWKL